MLPIIKMKLNKEEYRDSLYACWVGKNIGGTMGTPYENCREMQDIKGFVTEPDVVLPNDDLDLQLVWLYALETMGPQKITSNLLGEYWLSFIVPDWNEYGIGKNNMMRGLIPPLSGDYENNWRDSNGAWIRSEIWASVAPGCPDVAAKYAIEDAKVDHGAGEGTYAAAFVAALQSAAYVIKDLRRCIEIGLSMIPETTRIYDSVRFTMDLYDKGVNPRDAREMILEHNSDIGDGWFEAPSNVAYTVLGLLWGEGDFKKSMIYAINCGDDTDCTGATVGSTFGILHGMKGIPEDWRSHIGDKIVTVSINQATVGRRVPKTCTELTDRVMRQAPYTLFANDCALELTDGKTELPENIDEVLKNTNNRELRFGKSLREELSTLKPYAFREEFTFANVDVTLDRAPDIKEGEEIGVHLRIHNDCCAFDYKTYNLDFRWWLPEGFTVSGKKSAILWKGTDHGKTYTDVDFTITAGDKIESENRVVLEITAKGRFTPMYIPILLLG